MDSEPHPAAGGEGDVEACERVLARSCAWCAEPIQLRPRGTQRRYCSQGCRQRAYELRTAAARHAADIEAGRAAPSAEPVREVVERHTVRTVQTVRTEVRPVPAPPVPPDPARLRAREVEEYLEAAAAAVRSGQIGTWDHRRLMRGAQELRDALSATHPGGLDALLDRRR